MRKIILLIVSLGISNLMAEITTIKFYEEATYKHNGGYNYSDTLIVKFDDFHLVEYFKRDWIQKRFIDLKTQEEFRIILGQDYQKYLYKMEPDIILLEQNTTFEDKYLNRLIFQKQTVKNAELSIKYHYTNSLNKNYAPIGVLEGFVLEYWINNGNVNRHGKAISVTTESGFLEIPEDCQKTTKSAFVSSQRKNSPSRNDKLLQTGDFAPKIELLDLNGDWISLTDQRGKVVVLDFWAIGCRGCVHEIPMLNEFASKYESSDIEFWAISSDYPVYLYSFLNRKQFDWKVIPYGQSAFNSYKIWGMPSLIFIDKTGKIAATYYFTAIDQIPKRELRSLMKSLLK